MSNAQILFAFGLVLLVLSFVPVFSDPYHLDMPCVDFWAWAKRELSELWSGER
jgi:hypothetical protein